MVQTNRSSSRYRTRLAWGDDPPIPPAEGHDLGETTHQYPPRWQEGTRTAMGGAAHGEARHSGPALSRERTGTVEAPRGSRRQLAGDEETGLPLPGAVRNDTRSRIQAVALELFAEQGYEKTSLREIAERLSVTKAALYYHFKSKEDIVSSLLGDYFGEIDALIAWGASQPWTPGTRAEILHRYLDIAMNGIEVFRLLQQNQAAIQRLAAERGHDRKRFLRERMGTLVELLAGPDAPLRQRVRASAALFSVSGSCMFFLDQVADVAELRAIVSELANE